ncbi:hypothetical protein LJC28_00590 [Dysgonomonas sp. OttesenSCG-928-D17]|nr:hypothetical protein [Dysgonomonas sp. OttesenSCG-928-D17]
MRNLYERIIEYNGEKLYDDILIPWINNNNYKEYLKNIEGLLLENKDIAIEDSWELYALSRVLDIMTLRFQLNNKADGNNWLGPELKLKEYENFINLLGLTLKENIEYNSFYCEIINAIDGNDDFKIIENYHPPIILGNLLIKKGGVKITLNTQKYNLSIINNSTLY